MVSSSFEGGGGGSGFGNLFQIKISAFLQDNSHCRSNSFKSFSSGSRSTSSASLQDFNGNSIDPYMNSSNSSSFETSFTATSDGGGGGLTKSMQDLDLDDPPKAYAVAKHSALSSMSHSIADLIRELVKENCCPVIDEEAVIKSVLSYYAPSCSNNSPVFLITRLDLLRWLSQRFQSFQKLPQSRQNLLTQSLEDTTDPSQSMLSSVFEMYAMYAKFVSLSLRTTSSEEDGEEETPQSLISPSPITSTLLMSEAYSQLTASGLASMPVVYDTEQFKTIGELYTADFANQDLDKLDLEYKCVEDFIKQCHPEEWIEVAASSIVPSDAKVRHAIQLMLNSEEPVEVWIVESMEGDQSWRLKATLNVCDIFKLLCFHMDAESNDQ